MTGPRVALVTAPVSIEARYGQYAAAANTQPSFGIASLAATARKAGAEVKIIEASSLNLSVNETASLAKEWRPDLLGISATSVGIVAASELASRVKEALPDVLTVIGGCHASALPEKTMSDFRDFDLLAVGEGEATLSELVQRLSAGDSKPTDVQGTLARTEAGLRDNGPRPLIEDLDSLPMPAWNLIDGFPARFKPSPARIMRWPCASIVMTRGCPNACTFCERSVFGRKCRSYSPKYAADLFEDLAVNYGVKEILIEDDTFIISRKNVAAFCEELLKRDLRISWSCLGRADRADRELLTLMKKAGCWHISFGIESGDEDILKAVNKNLKLDQIVSALADCRAVGLRTKGFFMVGFPGESEESITATIDLVRTLKLDDISVMHLTPFPGSELAKLIGIQDSPHSDWQAMNALKPVYIPEGMTAELLEGARDRIYKAFFSRLDVLARHATHALLHPRLIPFYFAGARSLMTATRHTRK